MNTINEDNLNYLRGYMRSNFVLFKYKKSDGTVRFAIGTTNANFIDRVGAGDNEIGVSNSNKTIFPYYDFEKGDWRCFKKESFIETITTMSTIDCACVYAYFMAVSNRCVKDFISTARGLISTSKLTALFEYYANHCNEDLGDIPSKETVKEVISVLASISEPQHLVVEQPTDNVIGENQDTHLSSNIDGLIKRLGELRFEEHKILKELENISNVE